MVVSVIGLGLIGGSIARDLRKIEFARLIIGVDSNSEHLSKALELGIVDKVASLDEAISLSDLIIIAIPVDKILDLLPNVLDKIQSSTTVIDVGSTKKMICDSVENHPNRGNYVATHPMSGTEHSGPHAAIEGLFEGKITIICDQKKSKPQHIAMVEKMFHAIGMNTAYMSADEQDHTTAHVSHLPHATSFALANAVLAGSNRKIIFDLGSGGFHSTVRLAKSSPEMWGPIFKQNRAYVVESLDLYIKHLIEFKESIESDDDTKMMELMRNANRMREILSGENPELVKKEETNVKLYTKNQ